MKSLVFAVIWILLAAELSATEPEAVQAITDKDYGFVLNLPGEDWVLVEEAEISLLMPDILAGGYSRTHPGLWGAISVESIPGTDLKEIVRLGLENPVVEDQQTEIVESMVWQGWPAMRVVFSGKIDGVEVRYVQQVLAREDFVYQVMTWGPQAVLDEKGRQAQPFFDAFELLDGPVSARQALIAVRDQAGVGWRLVDGRFDSVVAGLAIRPPSPWRVMVGAELAEILPDAEVRLVRRDPYVHLALLVEKVPEENREAFEAQLWHDLIGDAVPLDMAPLAGMVGGEMVWFYGFEYTTATNDMLYGILWRGDYAVRILVWHLPAHREQIEVLLAEALSAIRFLPPSELDRLKSELAHTRDPQNVVGGGFALRGGLYRSFSSGFQWRKPAGFWRIQVGTATDTGSGVELYFQEPTLGLHGLIISELASGQSPDEYHIAATSDWLGNAVSAEHVITGGGDWRVSKGQVDVMGVVHAYRVATTVEEGRAIQVVVSGPPADMSTYAHRVTEVLAGFEFKPGLASVEVGHGRYVDHRMGFSLQPPVSWTRVDATPTPLQETRSHQVWSSGPKKWITLAAFTTPVDGQDDAWLIDRYQRRLNQEIGADQYRETQGELAGLPARHFSSSDEQTWILSRDRTHYILTASTEATAEFERVSGSFRLIDGADLEHFDAVPTLDQDSMRVAYIQTIQTAITSNWLRPITTPPGMRCAVAITQLPGGKITEVKITQPCNADELIRRSIIRAVQHTESLPYAGFEAVFEREVIFNFVYGP